MVVFNIDTSTKDFVAFDLAMVDIINLFRSTINVQVHQVIVHCHEHWKSKGQPLDHLTEASPVLLISILHLPCLCLPSISARRSASSSVSHTGTLSGARTWWEVKSSRLLLPPAHRPLSEMNFSLHPPVPLGIHLFTLWHCQVICYWWIFDFVSPFARRLAWLN